MSDYKGSFYSGNIYNPKYKIEDLVIPVLNDANGNAMIKFANPVANAVNEINISNSISGKSPTITVSGDDNNIGIQIFSKGHLGISFSDNSNATSLNSIAEGYSTTASGANSHAQGEFTIASGTSSHSEGTAGVASGSFSHVEGELCSASGRNSHAEGDESVASGNNSHAEGGFGTASGIYSHVEGDGCTASNETSHAEGKVTTANGYASHSQGSGTTANTFASHAIGNFNKDLTGNINSYVSTSDVFVIGNGSGPSAKNNAFRVTFDGKTYGLSAFNSSGADYAELFEWLDGNTKNEDRAGYFVTLDGDKIRKATSTDSYILGIVSVTPSVIGNNPDGWHKTYVTDDFGRIQHEEVAIPAEYKNIKSYVEHIDEDGVITKEEIEEKVLVRDKYTEIRPIYNPDWDSSTTYIPRENRKEWNSVGMMGVLLALDDGTCKVNGYCKSNDNGIATNSDTGYRVMKRVNKNIIQILVK